MTYGISVSLLLTAQTLEEEIAEESCDAFEVERN